MTRTLFVLLMASSLAACGGGTADNASEETARGAGASEAERANPSEMTAVDAASGYAGGMPAEAEAPTPPQPAERRETPDRAVDAPVTTPDVPANVTVPAAAPANATTNSQ